MKRNIPEKAVPGSAQMFSFRFMFLNFELHYKNYEVEGEKTELVLK